MEGEKAVQAYTGKVSRHWGKIERAVEVCE